MNFKLLATKDLFLLIAGILACIFIKGISNLIIFGIIIYMLSFVITFFSRDRVKNTLK